MSPDTAPTPRAGGDDAGPVHVGAAASLRGRAVLVVGCRGRMGAMLCRRGTAAGLVMRGVDVPLTDAVLAPACKDAALVLLCVPAAVFADVAATVCAHLPATAILADITSVKVRPLQQMEAVWPGPVVGTHPLFGDLREAGHEYGAATGRPRRVGPIDLVASRYGVFCQGCDEVALTLLDVLDYMEKIPMVTAYKLTDGSTTTRFPMGEALDTAQPVVEYLPGWHCDITAARKWEDLPKEARDYVEYLEKAVGCKITYISVGAEREAYIHHV